VCGTQPYFNNLLNIFIMNQDQKNQREIVHALNEINFKLGDLSTAMGVIVDLCKFYGDYDNLDERSRRDEALGNIEYLAKKAQDDALSLTDAVDTLFSENENSEVKQNN